MCVRRGRLAGRSEFRGVLQAIPEYAASQKMGSVKVQADVLSFGVIYPRYSAKEQPDAASRG